MSSQALGKQEAPDALLGQRMSERKVIFISPPPSIAPGSHDGFLDYQPGDSKPLLVIFARRNRSNLLDRNTTRDLSPNRQAKSSRPLFEEPRLPFVD
jgi:hypothetical protein